MATSRTERSDFQATSDPGLAPDQRLLTYHELYQLWERQQWATQDIDFTQDRRDWEGFSSDERFQRMTGLSAFFTGEQKVTDELGPIMRACPDEDMRIFLSTQIADEARHVMFFDRFYTEVGVFDDAGELKERLAKTARHLNDDFGVLFDEMLHDRVDRLAAEPEDLETLVEAITIYHMVIEGSLALTGQHFIIDYNEKMGTLPGFVEGFTNVARDEHRHVAFGARFLRDMTTRDAKYGEAIQRTLLEVGPVADGVLRPKWVPEGEEDTRFNGSSVNETRAFAVQALSRRLKVIGLQPAAA
jgi:ribonucleoside-diphosphate reductase beta chain